MRYAKISQVAHYVPSQVITNDDLSQIMDTSDEWISSRTGIKNRHITKDESTADLASQVAKQLLEKAEQAAKDYDNHIKYVLLDVEKNSWVVDWYKRCGYEVIKETDNYYTMEKTLNNV